MDNNTLRSKRPYVICHVISSLDGRISGSAFELPETIDAMEEHWKIRADFGCEAVMNGATTAAEIYADGFLGEERSTGDVLREGEGLHETTIALPGEDHIVKTDLENFVVCVDPDGILKWSRNYVDRPVQPKSHVIEVLLETVPEAYLEYLQGLGISYIFAGKDELDVDLLLEKLVDRFGINRLLITGGGIMDWTMLDADAIDEISVIITPTIGGERDVATMFDRPSVAFAAAGDGAKPKDEARPAVALELLKARIMDRGQIHLRFRARK